MQHRVLLFIAILLFTLTGCGEAQPQAVTNAAGKYKLLMPGTPKTKSQNTASGVTMHVEYYEEGNGAFLVAYADTPIPADESEADTQTRLDEARDGALTNANGLLISESRIKLADKYHGREFRGTVGKIRGNLVARVYIVDGRLYQIMALGKVSWINREVIKKCMDSFELLP